MAFNPFSKKFSEIQETDLEVLKTVAEGWYVEYKSQKIPAKKIAKSISSFANSYGGIFLLGVESDSNSNLASGFPGIPIDDISPDDIRNSISGNLQPFPYFETYSIQLSNGNRVLMTVVVEGDNPPYVCSDGKIYRRQEAASDPVAENNRATIDMLYENGRIYRKKLEIFRSMDLDFNRGEEKVPFFELYLNPSPFEHHQIKSFFDQQNITRIKELFHGNFSVTQNFNESPVTFAGDVNFDTVSTYSKYISLRDFKKLDLAYNGTTVLIDPYGNLKMLFPMNEILVFEDDSNQDFLNIINGYNGVEDINFVGMRDLLGLLYAVVSKQIQYLQETGFNGEVELVMGLSNFYRTSVYLDSQHYVNHVSTNGLPVCMISDQLFPKTPLKIDVKDFQSRAVVYIMGVFGKIAKAAGIPSLKAMEALVDEMQQNPQ